MSFWLQPASKPTSDKKTPNQGMQDPDDSQVRQIMIFTPFFFLLLFFDLLTEIYLTMNMFYSITLLL